LWAQGSRSAYAPPTQEDVAGFSPSVATFNSTVVGGDGTRLKGKGRSSALFSDQLSDNNPIQKELVVFITQVPRAQSIYFVGAETYKDILVNRYAPTSFFLNQSTKAEPADFDNGEVGAGTPFSGLQDVSFMAKFPAYVSRPYFLHNEDLLTRGISVTNFGQPIAPNSNDHETYLLVEPSTGLSFTGHKRLQASFSLYNCTSRAQGCTVGKAVTNLFSPDIPPLTIIPQYYMDETASLPDDKANQFIQLTKLSLAADCVLVVVTIVGGLGWFIGMFMCYRRYRGRRSLVGNYSEPLVPSKK